MSGELEGGGRGKANTQERKLGEKVPRDSKPASQRHVGSFHENASAELKVRGGYLHDMKNTGHKCRVAPPGGFFFFFLVPHMLYLKGICCNMFKWELSYKSLDFWNFLENGNTQ